MESQTYTDFSVQIHQKMAGQRLPVSGAIEITHRCPLTCAHCYNNLPMSDAGARRRELSTSEHVRILDEIAEAGCLWLLYTGGEIFARKDFLEIYARARDNGLLITLFTNGTLITPQVADQLLERRPFAIEITLYGATRATYEKLTGIPGSYDRCLSGIRALIDRGLPLKLKTVGVTINRHEIWDMKRLAEEEFGVGFKFDSMINPRIDCSRSPLAVRLKPSEVVAFDLQDPARMEEWRGFCDHFHGPAHAPERRDEVYHCGGGVNSFAIDPEGKLSICVLSHFDGYDLRRGSFREGWEHFLHQVRRKKIQRITKCTDCHLKSMCGMCPANGELEHGDPDAPVDFLCHVAHLRARVLGLQVPAHGDCEYCPGGSRHEALLQSLEEIDAAGEAVERPPEMEGMTLLPLVGGSAEGSGCGSGGCSTCGPAEKSWDV